MYCRVCGNPVKETETICKICGATLYSDHDRDMGKEKESTEKVASEEDDDKVRPYLHSNKEFSWNVYDFPKPKKTDDLKMEWPREPERPRRNLDLDEPISFDIDVFKKRNSIVDHKPTDSEPSEAVSHSDTGKQEFGKIETPTTPVELDPEQDPQSQNPGKPGKEFAEKRNGNEKVARKETPMVFQSSPASEVREDSVKEADKFFAFTQTNVEFQKLLDREYEKLRQRKQGVPYEESQWPFQQPTREEKELRDRVERECIGQQRVEESEEIEIPVSPEDALERMILSGTRAVDSDKEATIQVDLDAIKKAAEGKYGYIPSQVEELRSEETETTANEEDGGEAVEDSGKESGQSDAVKESGQSDAVAELTVEPDNSGEAEDPNLQNFRKRRTMTEMERAREEYFRMLDQEINGLQVKVEVNAGYGNSGKVVTDVDINPRETEGRFRRKKRIPVYEEPAGDDLQDRVVQPVEQVSGQDSVAATADAAGTAAEVGVEPQAKTQDQSAAPEDAPKAETPAEESAAVPETASAEKDLWPMDPWEYEAENQGEKKGVVGVIGKILLAIIGCAIALELIALGILYFAPDSEAAGKVYEIETKIVDVITGKTKLFGGDQDDPNTPVNGTDLEGTDQPDNADQTNSGDSTQNGDSTKSGEPDPKPMADITALIATQAGKNKNIISVTANSQLAYVAGTDYGVDDINNSKPIENNIWYLKEDGSPVYYDRELVGTLISFNSQWVDYVNGVSKDAVNLTKEGSRAYENATGFSKVGKVTEEFLAMEFGEIRQGENSFYLWVAEKIKLTEKGKTSTVDYKWVYCLEPVEKQMKIVNYIDVSKK